MRAKALSHNLKEAVAWIKPGKAKGVVALPVLNNVLVEAKHQGIRLTLTDLELAVSALAGGKISKVGATTIPFKEFERLVKSLPDGEVVHLKIERTERGKGKEDRWIDERCILTCGSLSVTFKTISANEFPTIKPVRGVTFEGVADLPQVCGLMLHAIEKEYHSRPALGYGQLLNGQLAAADGFRLAVVDVPSLQDKRPIYLHRELAEFLARQKEEPTKMVVGFKQEQMAVWFRDNVATASMYDGNYPDWKQIIPQSHTWEIRLPYGALKKATKLLKQLAPAAKILRLEYKRGKLVLKASESETFEATQQIEAMATNKPKEPFALNVEYLLDDLKARSKVLSDRDWIVLQGNSENSPVVITDFHSGLYEMIMPMHLSA